MIKILVIENIAEYNQLECISKTQEIKKSITEHTYTIIVILPKKLGFIKTPGLRTCNKKAPLTMITSRINTKNKNHSGILKYKTSEYANARKDDVINILSAIGSKQDPKSVS